MTAVDGHTDYEAPMGRAEEQGSCQPNGSYPRLSELARSSVIEATIAIAKDRLKLAPELPSSQEIDSIAEETARLLGLTDVLHGYLLRNADQPVFSLNVEV